MRWCRSAADAPGLVVDPSAGLTEGVHASGAVSAGDRRTHGRWRRERPWRRRAQPPLDRSLEADVQHGRDGQSQRPGVQHEQRAVDAVPLEQGEHRPVHEVEGERPLAGVDRDLGHDPALVDVALGQTRANRAGRTPPRSSRRCAPRSARSRRARRRTSRRCIRRRTASPPSSPTRGRGSRAGRRRKAVPVRERRCAPSLTTSVPVRALLCVRRPRRPHVREETG